MSLAFVLGLVFGLISGYFIRDVFKFIGRLYHRIFFRPVMLMRTPIDKNKK